ncbi:transcription factor [Stylosanthes scabra]|uniref:Transcription factor n=1 Tax=Stylosanthes scabra TaxID=79078 RepID=A0ABU6UDP6_9FABA|nr:transcription factor [Stylosanthes scabra]
MDLSERMQGVKSMMMMMGSRDYMEALEDERRKIQVFSKELPLSLDLVTQAIEACRQQLSGTTTEYNINGHMNMNNHSECSEQTTSTDNGPVLEEFIPIKKRPSSSNQDDYDYDDDDEDEQHSHHHRRKISKDDNNGNNKNSDKRKSDWLRSVQLWNNPEQPSLSPQQEVNNNKKGGAVEVKRSGSGGAFQPFHKDKEERVGGGGGKAIPSDDLKPPCSSAPAGSKNNSNNNNKEDKDGQRKQRRCWSQELHKRFLQALQQLGGPDSATPKQIRELMKVDGLTNDEVKSHLQKYRLHTRRPSPMVHNNANPQTTPFVLVGNIFVQQPEFAAAVATSADLATTAAPAGIYAPIATHPPPPLPGSTRKSQLKRSSSNHHSHSEEDRANNHNHNHNHLQSHSNSPASSSSTHTTTTTSPAY